MPLPPNGIYTANVIGACYYVAGSGAHMIEFIYETNEGEIKGGICLVTKAGALQEKAVKRLRHVFGWPSEDPNWFAENVATLPQVDITVADGNPKSDGSGFFREVKYVDKVGEAGGSGTESSHTPGDAKSFVAMFGPQMRAAGGAVQRPATPPPKATAPVTNAPPVRSAPAMPPPPRAPVAPAKPYRMEDAWVDYNINIGGELAKDEKATESAWLEAIGNVAGAGTQNDAVTDDQWRKIVTKATEFRKDPLPI